MFDLLQEQKGSKNRREDILRGKVKSKCLAPAIQTVEKASIVKQKLVANGRRAYAQDPTLDFLYRRRMRKYNNNLWV
jgi:hypothetical protein